MERATQNARTSSPGASPKWANANGSASRPVPMQVVTSVMALPSTEPGPSSACRAAAQAAVQSLGSMDARLVQ